MTDEFNGDLVEEGSAPASIPAPAIEAPDPSSVDSILDTIAKQKAAAATPEIVPEQSEGDKTAIDRARDEQGRFTKAEADAKAAKELADGKVAAPEGEETADDPEKPAAEPSKLRPPPGFSVKTKAEWESYPEHLKADIAKREEEVNEGFKRYSGLGEYAKLCEQNGTTLAVAMTNYRALETALQKDFVGGLDAIVKWHNADPRAVVMAMAKKYGLVDGGAQQPAQQQPQQFARQEPAFDPQSLIAEARRAAQEAMEQREAQSQIAAFEADPNNRYFDNVRDRMETIIRSGSARTLKDAYDQACWANPEIRALLIKEQVAPPPVTPPKPAAVPQARAAAKHVGGAPSPGFKPGTNVDPNASVMDTVMAAIAAQKGARA